MLVLALIGLVPSEARATSCGWSCAQICYANGAATYRAEVISAADGRVRLLEHLSGASDDSVGDEVSADVAGDMSAGTQVFVTIGGDVPAMEIYGNEVECDSSSRVPIDALAAMAVSDVEACGVMADDLDLGPTCGEADDGGCSTGAGSSLGFGAVGAFALMFRRRRRA